MTGTEYFYSRLPLFIIYGLVGIGAVAVNALLLRHERRVRERHTAVGRDV